MHSFTYKLKLTGLALFVVVVGLVAEAAAQIPRPNVFQGGNRWRITAYEDASPVHQQLGTQDVCFLPFAIVGTHIRGVWFSPTFPGWTGRYSQEGDRVLMYGNWGNFIGSDGIFIELTEGTSPRDVGAGQWTEWFNFGANGTLVTFANARLARVGTCLLPTNADTMTQAELEVLATDRARSVEPRLRKDGKVSDHPLDPEQEPLPEEQR